MERTTYWVGQAFSFSGFLSVLLGAFGAHILKSHTNEYQMGVYQTAVQYQFFHSLALGLVFLLLLKFRFRLLNLTALFFTIGILIFSGSLYALVLTGKPYWGMFTPIGGMALLLGWLNLFLSIRRMIKQNGETICHPS